MIPKAKLGGRRRKYSERTIITAIFYLLRTGVAWRYLPKEFPPWQTTYRYFASFTKCGIWLKIANRFHECERSRTHLLPKTPSFLIIDSQSVKAQYGEERGYDGFKKVRGRKRHIIVDSLGLPYAVHVTSAAARDAPEGLKLLSKAKKYLKGLEELLVDGGYKTRVFFEEVIEKYHVIPMIRSSTTGTIKAKREGRTLIESSLRPRRWIVERSFAWLINFRRLNRDYERKIIYCEVMLQIAMAILLLHRLAPP